MLTEALPELRDDEYELFRTLIYRKCGINLGPQKQMLLRSRLGKQMRAGGYRSYREYYEFVSKDATGGELVSLIDAVSTNTTHLFREKQHFDLLDKLARQWANDAAWRRRNTELRVWSAGCSSGEEPYTIAIVLDDALGGAGLDWRILATDISTKVLDKAQQGVYEPPRMEHVPEVFKKRYFTRAGTPSAPQHQVVEPLRKRIRFARLNLMDESYPFKLGFHVIFCRNVMIYFDRQTQEALVRRFSNHLAPGGHLLIGHSESLNAIRHELAYVQPTVYRRDA